VAIYANKLKQGQFNQWNIIFLNIQKRWQPNRILFRQMYKWFKIYLMTF
jgi:hypothetical protein